MLNKLHMQNILAAYKQHITSSQWWNQEKFKWEAVKCFQDNWDVNASDFAEMLNRSLDKTFNLLASNNNFPKGMITEFANAAPEEVRAMFIALFDEKNDVVARILQFKDSSKLMLEKYGNGANQHFQSENAISTYLWLRFPDKYYIYKYGEVKSAAEKLDCEYKFKKGAYSENLRYFFLLYDEISAELKKDDELVSLMKANITDDCYSDPECKTLTIDVGFFINRCYSQNAFAEANSWFPANYSPEISVEQWVELIGNPEVFTTGSLEIMKRFKDYGGQATCTQLAVKYGETKNFYNSGSTALARRVAKKTNCPLMPQDEKNSCYWPILFVGHKAEKDDEGSYIWKLRVELSKALDMVELSSVKLFAKTIPAFWKISHGTKNTGVSDINKKILLERKVVAVHSLTKAKAGSKTTQGQSFIDEIKKGDFFYLCYGNSIQLLGQFSEENPVENSEIGNGWYERSYRVIAESNDTSAYNGVKKWWTPNENSTCIKISEEEQPLFEELILIPYFKLTIDNLKNKENIQKNYWWLTANPKIWSYSNIKIGEEESYTLYNENGNKRRIFQNFLDAKPGDIVIGYEASPVKKIVAIAEITQLNDGKNLYFAKKEGLSAPIDYTVLKESPELEKMEFFVQPNGSLFKLSKDEFDFIMDVVRENNPLELISEKKEQYSKKDFLDSVFMNETRYNDLEALLRNKKNIILQGAPGVGKTYISKKLAYSMMGEKDDARIEFIQFHQNYSYEDFIMGYRPDGESFKLTDGIFYRFCKKAENNPDKEYFFIIDEINRGNMSKIFGELMMLIEKDYRGTKAILPYSGIPFSVPANLYIIGMMNTADRSLAMIDYALRRRFSFFSIEPGFDSEGFIKYRNNLNNDTFNELIEHIKRLNKEIAADKSLGKGFCIGHSYFCGQELCTDEWLRSVVEYDILPMLAEYWFDDNNKLQRWENILRGVFQ